MIQISSDIRPLSVNEAWQGRRFKTKRYLSFERDLLLTLPKCEPIFGKVRIEIECLYKRDKMRDIDNAVKPILDVIVKRGYIEDDRYVYELVVKKRHAERDGFNLSISKICE